MERDRGRSTVESVAAGVVRRRRGLGEGVLRPSTLELSTGDIHGMKVERDPRLVHRIESGEDSVFEASMSDDVSEEGRGRATVHTGVAM